MDASSFSVRKHEQPETSHVYGSLGEAMRIFSEDNRRPLRGSLMSGRTGHGYHRSTWMPSYRWPCLSYGFAVLLMCLLITPAQAVFINFENCLSSAYKNSTQLQFVPLLVDASFSSQPPHNLKITVYGNVTGSYLDVHLPSPNDPAWTNPNITDGKIENLAAPFTKYTTVFNKVNVLTYQPWNQAMNFCDQLINRTCPLAPAFYADPYNPHGLPAFSMSHDFGSSYAFATFATTLSIIDGDTAATALGCISVDVTPDLGSGLSAVLTFIPMVILVFVGLAVAFAAVFSPWGSTDIFKWTTNYGRDADLLRLVTPGFGDCLQYLQFVTLTGGLSLSYPGFYQPVVSKVAWSSLMFNESFVTRGPGTKSLVDGIYVSNGTYGLDNLSQFIGITDMDDIWTGMAVWLLVILGAVMLLIQLGFLCRWIYRQLSEIQEEDLRAKNMPFSVGNVVRIVFNDFLLPIVSLSMFQLVITGSSPPYVVVLAVVMLLAVVGFAAWLLYLVATTRPRSFLFDDLPTVLLYGSLYNTYSDNAAPFALVPVLMTFVRGVAIGAVQPSGIAQLVILAICEVITILTLHAFRPFHSPTSMNAYHTFFAAVRFATILLMVAFATSLGISDGPKGWIGYAILLMHAVVLIFGFFLNAIQTIIEVVARLAGAGDDNGAARGGFAKVFGVRQLSRRLPRDNAGSRQSQLSSAGMLGRDRKSSQAMNEAMMRSQSDGSAAILLNRPLSVGLDSSFEPSSSYGQAPSGEASAFSFLPSAAGGRTGGRNRGTILNLSTAETADPYYRPPRLRRPTLEAAYSPGARSRGSWASGEWANKTWSQVDVSSPTEGAEHPFEGPSISGRGTPVPAFATTQEKVSGLDSLSNENRRSQTDYTTREVDFYYGVRGPALNKNVPGRRLRTGPVDPTGPVSVAGGWFKGLFGGKTKEKGKGFEVVRSARMPPGMKARDRAGGESPPEGVPVVAAGAIRRDLDDDEPTALQQSADIGASQPILDQEGSDASDIEGDDEEFEMTRISDIPPSLPGIQVGGDDFQLPSRFASKASSRNPRNFSVPCMPSQRSVSHNANNHNSNQYSHGSTESSRLPFERTGSHNRTSTISTNSSIMPVDDDSGHRRQTSSVLGNLSPEIHHDRPTSIGRVNHSSILTINPATTPGFDLLSSSAEFVNNDRRSENSKRSYDEKRRQGHI